MYLIATATVSDLLAAYPLPLPLPLPWWQRVIGDDFCRTWPPPPPPTTSGSEDEHSTSIECVENFHPGWQLIVGISKMGVGRLAENAKRVVIRSPVVVCKIRLGSSRFKKATDSTDSTDPCSRPYCTPFLNLCFTFKLNSYFPVFLKKRYFVLQ